MKTMENKQYRVDAGEGELLPNCPYSCFEDGHDVKEFITPPLGFNLAGFNLKPEPESSGYDGCLVAQYEPKSISPKLKTNLIVAACALLLVAAGIMLFSLFRNNHQTPAAPQSEPVVIDATSSYFSIKEDTAAIDETETVEAVAEVVEPEAEKAVAESAPTETVQDKQLAEVVEVIETPVVQETPQPVQVVQETKPAQEVKPIQEVKPVQEVKKEPVAQTTVDAKEQFRKEFWVLIHRQEKNMRTYYDLYNQYKNKNLRSKEFFYLYLTILENTSGFNAWKAKLVQVPSEEIKSIQNVNALEQKLNEYE